MQEHTVKAFDEDITRLRGLIAEMGGLAEVAIEESMRALVSGDEELASAVVERGSPFGDLLLAAVIQTPKGLVTVGLGGGC